MNNIYIIAEAGVNHNGSLALAKKLIDVASLARADAVKFQTFKAEEIITKHASKAEYQKKTTAEIESQYEMVKNLELNEQDHLELIKHCLKRKIQFLSTPFDFDSIDLLANTFNLPCLKIPSGEINNGPYLLAIAQTAKKVILSTGMSSLDEVETALGVLAFGYLRENDKPSLKKVREAFRSEAGKKILKEKVVLLHCTTEYPAPFEEVNLRAMGTMRNAFSLPVGLSDHTQGIAVPIAAAALGAVVIEKHFTLDKKLPGPDHKASLEPDELERMIIAVRQIEVALGNGKKIAMPVELKNRDIVRKSMVAAKKINQGEVFTVTNLAIKRPGNGISPMKYWELIGQKATQDYDRDELIHL